MTIAEVRRMFGFDEASEALEANAAFHREGQMVSSKLEVDRSTTYPAENEIQDIFSTKEMGGVNKKRIIVHYRDGLVDQKGQMNVE